MLSGVITSEYFLGPWDIVPENNRQPCSEAVLTTSTVSVVVQCPRVSRRSRRHHRIQTHGEPESRRVTSTKSRSLIRRSRIELCLPIVHTKRDFSLGVKAHRQQ